MLTFLELYQTLLGFVLFKLYTDVELVYPPPLDISRDEEAAGVGAYNLQDAGPTNLGPNHGSKPVDGDGNIVKGRDVRKTIKELAAISLPSQEILASSILLPQTTTEVTGEDEFVSQSSSTDIAVLPTLHSITRLPSPINTSLLAPFTFFLALGSPRPLLEFVIRSFGGRVGWPSSMGSGSPITEDDEKITHVIIDRPIPAVSVPSTTPEELRRTRKYVQPQWVVDSINAQRTLAEGPYAQGQTLPPHLSPFGEEVHAYVPETGDLDATDLTQGGELDGEEEELEADSDVSAANEDPIDPLTAADVAMKAAAQNPMDLALLRAAELEAERAGRDTTEFESSLRKALKKEDKDRLNKPPGLGRSHEAEMNKMMMSNKKRRLYERMKFSEHKKATEVGVCVLETE
jgi:pescadillo